MDGMLFHHTLSNKPNSGDPTLISSNALAEPHDFLGGALGQIPQFDPAVVGHARWMNPAAYNVKTYGAVGDGAADDTVAIQAAITAAGFASVYNQPLTGLHSAGGGIVYFPVGVYKVTSALPYASGLTFAGDGVGSEILFYPAATPKQLFAPGTNYFFDTTPYTHAYMHWRDLLIYGYGAYAQDGIYWDGVSFSTLENVTVTGFTRYGVFVGDSHGVGAYYNQVTHPHLLNSGTDLYVGAGANALHVNGGRIRDTLGTPAYLVDLNGTATSFDGVAFEGSPTVALIHDKGVGTSITNYCEESNATNVFVLRDASLNYVSGLTICGGSGVSQPVKYENFDLTAAMERGDSRPDSLGFGSPVSVPGVVNGAFRKGVYGWTHYYVTATGDDAESMDTATIFCAPASLKMVHAANVHEAGVYQDVDLTNYQGKQVYITALVKFTGSAWPDVYLQLDSTTRSKHLHPIVDYGNGWQLWMTSANVTSASVRLTIGLAMSSATCYVGLVQMWVGGIPQLPTELTKDETFRASAAPTTGTWAVGDRVWNSAPSAGGAPGWVCTGAGTPGTWKAMANLAA